MKLYYFNLKGRAETARLMLRLGAVHFEDIVYSDEEWGAKYKAISPSGKVCSDHTQCVVTTPTV
jgi:glutathione S-transferase